MKTSDQLKPGSVYTRDDLRALFGITDATLNTGVFRPKGHDSVWLFVTEQKTADRTPYADRLESDSLFWQGQTSGRTDSMIIRHAELGLELLLFYRRAKYEFPKAGFRFDGAFGYVSHFGAHPTSFLLHRLHLGAVTGYPLVRDKSLEPLRICEPDEEIVKARRPDTLNEVVAWIALQDRVSEAELRTRLFPLDLLPAALIDELNNRALDLTGDIALAEDKAEIVVARDILMRVIATWE